MSWYITASTEKLADCIEKQIKKLLSSVDLCAASKAVRSYCKSCSDKIPKIRIGKIDGFTIFIVNGDLVKTELEMNFVEGANDQAYSSRTDKDVNNVIPHDEVWLSSETLPQYIPYILYHELIEAFIMKQTGCSYDKAHEIANKHEKIARKSKTFG